MYLARNRILAKSQGANPPFPYTRSRVIEWCLGWRFGKCSKMSCSRLWYLPYAREYYFVSVESVPGLRKLASKSHFGIFAKKNHIAKTPLCSSSMKKGGYAPSDYFWVQSFARKISFQFIHVCISSKEPAWLQKSQSDALRAREDKKTFFT